MSSHRYHGLLGTVVEVRVSASTPAIEDEVDALMLAELERLHAMLNARDPSSDLRRWARGEILPTPEVASVVALAEHWRERSGGAYDPAVGVMFDEWSRAEERGGAPRSEDLDAAVASLSDPDVRRRWCDPTGLAKGWIVDRVHGLGVAFPGVSRVTVDAGGDMRHGGEGSARVGIEDPLRPIDNAPPIEVVTVSDCALATSGPARRWWVIEGERVGQTLDPRTGRSVDGVASATVVAPDAATADAVATAVVVLGPDAGVDLVEELDDVDCLVVDSAGRRTSSSGWPGRAFRPT